jgi:predicted ATPase
MKIHINQKHKSIPAGLSFDLPEFTIFTGINGSGKSHMLEVISNPSLSSVIICDRVVTNIKLVNVNSLIPIINEICDDNTIKSHIDNYWNKINNFINQCKSYHEQNFENLKQQPFFGSILQNCGLKQDSYEFKIIEEILLDPEKNIQNITYKDVSKFVKFDEMPNNDIFNSNFSLIFKGYSKKIIDNKFNKFLNVNEHHKIDYLEDTDFEKKYGPPPWMLINEILCKASLPYVVNEPNIDERDLPYKFQLIDKYSGTIISANDLSSGEKVLLSLALAIYNTNGGNSKLDLLLLDEPDAPLHPNFSKLFIETVYDVIVKKAGVKVIMTTHSPTTVAMAPDNSIYEIPRDTKVPRPVIISNAIKILTKGLEFLKVSTENRRLIFVESKNDVLYFTKYFEIFQQKNNYKFIPIFLEPHKGTSNCSDVINIVNNLQKGGSYDVYGVIDYDNKNKSTDSIFVLGDCNRYAIDNYILDPLFIALALIRARKKTFKDFGVLKELTYVNASTLTEVECQTIVDHFFQQCSFQIDDCSDIYLENGFKLKYPKKFLNYHGHDYEKLIEDKIREIKALYPNGRGESALKIKILEIAEEYSEFISKDISAILSKLLN